MDWTENEILLLTHVLPDVAARLRMPLGNLYLACQRLLAKADVDEQSPEAAIFQQSYYRLMRTVNNLTFAPHLLDTELLPVSDVDLTVWLDELCRQAQPLFDEAGVSLALCCAQKGHIAGINREAMDRLVWNLLSNALKFTEPGGGVTITLESAAGQVLLSVSDTGCGISQELLPLVYDRWLHYDRIDPLEHGFGLGLPICRRIAQGHGGRLLLRSEAGEGTRVTVALPDKKSAVGMVEDVKYDYAGGFQRVLLELSDALPHEAYTKRHLDD